MKIAWLHYHLKPGGVTTVIRRQAAAVQNDCETLIVTGGTAPEGFPAPHIRIHGIGYDDSDSITEEPRYTAEAVESAIRSRWKDGCDVIHVHNPLLAKKRHFLQILDHLKRRGFRLFLQVHDFAEDGRPWSYYHGEEYPADCHYGVLNSRDYAALNAAGLSAAGLHFLPNMVEPCAAVEGSRDSRPELADSFVLYPVRAIRRKNIGEALLLSLFFPPEQSLAITLPPNSPRDWKVYREWKKYAGKQGLQVLFEASTIHDYKGLVNGAVCVLSTSISEGFGFAFLEPWIAGKALTGRLLPDICRDYEKNGVRLDHLYDRLNVPMHWVDESAFRRKWRDCIRRVGSGYGRSMADPEIETGYRKLTKDGSIDFAMLDEPFQRQVIGRLLDDPSACDLLKQENPFLSNISTPRCSKSGITENREAVLRAYRPEAYRERLLDIYRKVSSLPVRHRIDRQILLGQFLHPETFSLLKWCDNAL